MAYDEFQVYCKESKCLCIVKEHKTIIRQYENCVSLPFNELDELLICESVHRANDLSHETHNYVIECNLYDAMQHICTAGIDKMKIHSCDFINDSIGEVEKLKIWKVNGVHYNGCLKELKVLEYGSNNMYIEQCDRLTVYRGSFNLNIERIDGKIILDLPWNNIKSINVGIMNDFTIVLKNYTLGNTNDYWGRQQIDESHVCGFDVVIDSDTLIAIQLHSLGISKVGNNWSY